MTKGDEPMTCKHCGRTATFRTLPGDASCPGTRTGRHFFRSADPERCTTCGRRDHKPGTFDGHRYTAPSR